MNVLEVNEARVVAAKRRAAERRLELPLEVLERADRMHELAPALLAMAVWHLDKPIVKGRGWVSTRFPLALIPFGGLLDVGAL